MQMFMSAIAHSTSYELESRAKFELVVLQSVCIMCLKHQGHVSLCKSIHK